MDHRRWFIGIFFAVLAASLAATGVYTKKAWRTYTLLEAARALDMPEAAAVRGWMTVGYVATYYRVPLGQLLHRLDLPQDTAATQTLRDIASGANQDAPAYVLNVQRAIAALTAATPAAALPAEPAGWFSRLTDAIYSALLVYGYPVLVGVLFLGALGLPLPAGPLTAIAGTLALRGEIDGAIAAGLAVFASVLGDVAGYGAGRLLSPAFLDRHGRWIGYTQANRERLQRLFARWGGLLLILTRSLTAHVGAIVSVLAGAGRYPPGRFLAYSLAGRLLWTASYFGLGYAIGTDFEAASGFLGYLSLSLIALAVAATAAGLLWRSSQGASLP